MVHDQNTTPQLKPLRILIVDDSRVIQALLECTLKRLGHEVTTVSTGCAACAITREKTFDLIFMDLQMPEMDGMEATNEIRGRKNDDRVLIVGMTAQTLSSIEQDCYDAGMDGFLPKQFLPERIASVLEQLTNERRTRRLTC